MNLEQAKQKFEILLKDSKKSVDELGRNDKAYCFVKNLQMKNQDEKFLSLNEKFALLGYPRTEKPATLDRIRQEIQKYIARTGLDPNSMHSTDPEFKNIKSIYLIDANRHRLTVEEKFTLAGYHRSPKHSPDVKQSLINDINQYLAANGSLHIARKKLPFWERLSTYRQKLCKESGREITSEQVMKNLGYKNYSDTYFRFNTLEKLSSYRDQSGFVDSYRKDIQFKAFIESAAKSLAIPIPVLLEVVCEENVEHNYISVDYITYVKNRLLNYAKAHDNSLKGLRHGDPTLYEQLHHIRKFLNTEDGEKISVDELISVLGLEGITHCFYNVDTKKPDIGAKMYELQQTAIAHNGKITSKDIPQNLYMEINRQANRFGITMKEFFILYDIDYASGISPINKFKMFHIGEYPYVDKMRKRKHEIMAQHHGENLCKEELFELNISAGKQAYDEYKDLIYESLIGSSDVDTCTITKN